MQDELNLVSIKPTAPSPKNMHAFKVGYAVHAESPSDSATAPKRA